MPRYARRNSVLCTRHANRCGRVNSLGPKRWAYKGSDSFATGITFHGDLQGMLIPRHIHQHPHGRTPCLARTLPSAAADMRQALACFRDACGAPGFRGITMSDGKRPYAIL